MADQCRAVLSPMSRALTSAPCSMRNLTIWQCPLCAARISGVSISTPRCSMSAPSSSSSRQQERRVPAVVRLIQRSTLRNVLLHPVVVPIHAVPPDVGLLGDEAARDEVERHRARPRGSRNKKKKKKTRSPPPPPPPEASPC